MIYSEKYLSVITAKYENGIRGKYSSTIQRTLLYNKRAIFRRMLEKESKNRPNSMVKEAELLQNNIKNVRK